MTNAREQHPFASLPTGGDIRLNWDLRLPQELERRFRLHFRDASQPLIRVACPLMLAVYVLAFFVEHHISPAVIEQTWQPRLLCMLATGAVFVSALQYEYQHHLEMMIIAMVLIFVISHIHMAIMVQHPFAYIYFYIVLIGILFMATLFRVIFWRSVAISTLVLLMTAVGMFVLSRRSVEEMQIGFSFILISTVITLTGQYFHERLQRRFFLSESVLSTHRSELHSANRLLESQVTEDGLTGTVNRRGMDSRLAEMFHRMRSRLRGAPESISVLLFDIDDFKAYNDTYGHQAGDHCLQQIAAIPRGMIQRASDFVARYGGEEFIIVLSGTRMGDALVFAERLRSRVQQLGIPHKTASATSVVTISVGVAGTGSDCLDSQTLIARADTALYRAKNAGRNCVASYSEDGDIRVHLP